MTTAITTDGLEDFPAPAAAIMNAQWSISSGTSDIIEASYNPPILGLTDGLLLMFRYTGAGNATTTPTFSPDGNTGLTIRKNAGALSVGDLKTNGEYSVRYNLALNAWTLATGNGVG